MPRSLTLRSFRGLRAVDLDELRCLNLIVGGNNVGKTSLLEALVLLYGNASQLQQLPVLFRRGACDADGETDFWPLLAREREFAGFLLETPDVKVFAQPADDGTCQLLRTGKNANAEAVPLLGLDPAGRVAIFRSEGSCVKELAIITSAIPAPAESAALYQVLAEQHPSRAERLQLLLQEALEPRAQALKWIAAEGKAPPALAIDLGCGPAIPFTQMGQGFARCFHLLCEVLLGRARIVLIDEVESGLYYRSLEPLLRGLLPLLEELDVQLFATTHSLECMLAAARAGIDLGSTGVRYIRLDRHSRDPEQIQAVTFAADTLQAAMNFGEEMR